MLQPTAGQACRQLPLHRVEQQVRRAWLICCSVGHDRCPFSSQTLMFSATWPTDIQRLASEFLSDPVKITIGSQDLSASHSVSQVRRRVLSRDTVHLQRFALLL